MVTLEGCDVSQKLHTCMPMLPCHWFERRLTEMFCFVYDPQKSFCTVTIAIHITLHPVDVHVPTKFLSVTT